MIDNKTARWVMIGNFVRYIGFFCLLFYMPIYFTKTYPERVSDFSQYNALIEIFLANISALMGGLLSDKFEKETYYSKPAIVIGSAVISGPIMCLGLLEPDNFAFSMWMVGLHFVFSQAFESPGITMLQNSTESQKQGFANAINQTVLTLGGLLSTTLFGIIV